MCAPCSTSAAARARFSALELRAAARALSYAQESQPAARLDVQRIAPYDPSDQLLLDDAAVRNLELVTTLGGERKGSLLHVLDETKTAMGARLLRRRLLAPLTDVARIRRQHDRVEALLQDAPLRDALQLASERISPTSNGSRRARRWRWRRRATWAQSAIAWRPLPQLRTRLLEAAANSTDDALKALVPDDVVRRAARAISRRARRRAAAAARRRAACFAPNTTRASTSCATLSEHSKDVIQAIEQREREQTALHSLKIRFTKVFGYYIEITKSKLGAVPAHYRRKQTVAGGERFTTDELEQVAGQDPERRRAPARARAASCSRICALWSARASAELQTLGARAGRARCQRRAGRGRASPRLRAPSIDDSLELELIECRHPIVERAIAAGRFVPNDVALDASGMRLLVITGPNMAGKSTAMRQVALAVILAQIGRLRAGATARASASSTASTRASARATTSRKARARSWSRCTRPRASCAAPRGARWSSWTRSAAAPAPTTGSRSPGRSPSTCTTRSAAARCSPRTTTSCASSRARARPSATSTSPPSSTATRWCSCTSSSPAAPTAATASRSLNSRAFPRSCWRGPGRCFPKLESGGALPSGAQASLRGRGAAARSSPQLEIFAPPPAPQGDSDAEATLRALDIERMTPVEALVALARLQQMLPPKDSPKD